MPDVPAFMQYFTAGGWLMYPLATCMFLIWLFYFSLLAELRATLQTPEPDEMELPKSISSDHDLHLFYERLQGRKGIVPKLMRECLQRVRGGLPFREAFMQCRQPITGRYSYCFYMLGALVTAAPLLGLLGTVLGMIQTFKGVGLQSTETATQIADGISQALITTQIGLVAALPGTFGLVHLFRLYRRLQNTMDQCESHLALAIEHNVHLRT